MTPNERRLADLDRTIARFRPHAVVDVVLHACHGYNVESYKVMKHVKEKGIPFLKIETDYSTNDTSQLMNRVEALLETARQGG
jgi:benzoyl-CoA reductase/2-hydroxyglutaryl-CoA dehydratase subunit BcrC/BadD/HgdB